MSSDINISINLEQDFAEILRNRLIAAGYSVPVSDGPQELCFQYFNALRRRINPIPRVVLMPKWCIHQVQAAFGIRATPD